MDRFSSSSRGESTELSEDEWIVLNRRVAVLTERTWFSSDKYAADELEEIFDRWIRRLVRAAGARFLGFSFNDYRAVLLADAFVVSRTAVVKRKDRPLGYVVRALRRKYRRELAREHHRQLHEVGQPQDEWWPRNGAPDGVMSVARARELDLKFRQRINEWRRTLSEDEDDRGVLCADVIETCYRIDCTQTEAYQILGLTVAEGRAVAQRLSRMRANPKSNLYWLATLAGDDEVQDTLRRRADRHDRRTLGRTSADREADSDGGLVDRVLDEVPDGDTSGSNARTLMGLDEESGPLEDFDDANKMDVTEAMNATDGEKLTYYFDNDADINDGRDREH